MTFPRLGLRNGFIFAFSSFHPLQQVKQHKYLLDSPPHNLGKNVTFCSLFITKTTKTQQTFSPLKAQLCFPRKQTKYKNIWIFTHKHFFFHFSSQKQ